MALPDRKFGNADGPVFTMPTDKLEKSTQLFWSQIENLKWSGKKRGVQRLASVQLCPIRRYVAVGASVVRRGCRPPLPLLFWRIVRAGHQLLWTDATVAMA